MRTSIEKGLLMEEDSVGCNGWGLGVGLDALQGVMIAA